jgi:hypothetical protein
MHLSRAGKLVAKKVAQNFSQRRHSLKQSTIGGQTRVTMHDTS